MLVAIGALFLGVPDGREAHVLDFMEKSSARTLTPQQQQEQAQQQAQQELAAAAMGNAGGEVDEGRALLLAQQQAQQAQQQQGQQQAGEEVDQELALPHHEHEYFGNGTNTLSGNATSHRYVDSNVTMRRQSCSGFTVEDVARTWMEAISPISPSDAAGMCVAAVAIAAGESYDVPGCAKKFHPTVTNSVGASGLWQIMTGFSSDPKEQARTVYQKYTSNDPGYGCLSKWCVQRSGCSEPLVPEVQSASVMRHHRFCQGMWTGPPQYYSQRLQQVGGVQRAQKACQSTGLGYRESAPAGGGGSSRPQQQRAPRPKAQKKHKKMKNPYGCKSLAPPQAPTGWCIKNCKLGNCPENLCKCETQPPTTLHKRLLLNPNLLGQAVSFTKKLERNERLLAKALAGSPKQQQQQQWQQQQQGAEEEEDNSWWQEQEQQQKEHMLALLAAAAPSEPTPDAAARTTLFTNRASSSTQPSVTVAGDHAMSLSDGQSFEKLNTGVVIYPGVAGEWTPAEHQHKIRAEDLAKITAPPSVKKVVIGTHSLPTRAESCAPLFTHMRTRTRTRARHTHARARALTLPGRAAGLGMVGGGKAALMDDAKEKVAALEADGVEVHVGSTPESKETYNKLLAEEPEGTVAALFHTGCL